MENLKSLKSTGTDEDISQYLTFKLGNEIYGIDVQLVKEIIEFEKVFRVPRVPDNIRGVMNLRGEVIPVIDLSSRLYGRRSEITRLTDIIVIELEDEVRIGTVIDMVRAVIDIDRKDVEPAPEFGSMIRPDFISGIAKQGDRFIILLNLGTLLDTEELADFKRTDERLETAI